MSEDTQDPKPVENNAEDSTEDANNDTPQASTTTEDTSSEETAQADEQTVEIADSNPASEASDQVPVMSEPQKEDSADTTQETVESGSKKDPSRLHASLVTVAALLVAALLVAIAVAAYNDSNNKNDSLNQLPATNAATENSTSKPNTPATEADVAEEINNIDAVIEEINNLGDPVDGLDDSSLGI